MNRRHFLFGLVGLGVIASGVGFRSLKDHGLLRNNNEKRPEETWLISACRDRKGKFYAAAFTITGELISKVPLPARGHDVLAIKSKPGHALVFARRPGNFILEVDFTQGEIVQQIQSSSNQHFYGHGVLVDDDKTLVSTENDYQQGKGLIVLRELKSQKIIEQYDSGGIGPHQIAVMPTLTTSVTHSGMHTAHNADNIRLVIANGGIKTHPAHARQKLNIATMEPNLAYLELVNGKIIDSFSLENKQLSIRHLDVSEQGKVIAGLQYQGASTDQVPLVISHHGEDKLQFLHAQQDVWQSMKHYTASVCINNANNSVAISCPKANLITYWDLQRDEFISSYRLKDNAGLAMIGDSMIASTGRGVITQQFDPYQAFIMKAKMNELHWDNHMSTVSYI